MGLVERMKSEQARGAEENQRLARELDAMRARLGDRIVDDRARHHSGRERDVIRSRVGEMLDELEALEPLAHVRPGPRNPVDIQGRRLPDSFIALDPQYIAKLAMYVEDKMPGGRGQHTERRFSSNWLCSPRSTSPTSSFAAATRPATATAAWPNAPKNSSGSSTRPSPAPSRVLPHPPEVQD